MLGKKARQHNTTERQSNTIQHVYVCANFTYMCNALCGFQKKVVDLVKKKKKAVTLAIGDGANDVGMIKGTRIYN